MTNIEDEIIKERKKLIDQINKYGYRSPKALEQSQKCDRLIFEVTKKEIEKKSKRA